MSARQPFVPSRTASRAAQLGDHTQPIQDFVADASNPLHRHSARPQKPVGTNKPLNIAGLLKRNDSQPVRSVQLPQTPRKSSEDIVRPGTANALESHTGMNRRTSLQIVAPTPSHLLSNTPTALLSTDTSAFRTPALPSASNKPASLSHFQVDLTTLDAHIPSPVAGAEFSSHGSSGSETRALGMFTSLNSDSPSKARLQHPDYPGSAEKVVESTDKQHGDPEGFALSNGGGPIRVLLNSRPCISGRGKRLGNILDSHPVKEPDDGAGDGYVPVISSVHRQKRSRAERYDDDTGDEDHTAKRGRYDAETMDDASWKAFQEYGPMPTHHSSYHQQGGTLGLEMQPPHNSQAYAQVSRQHSHSGSTLPVSPTSNHEDSPWSQHHPHGSPQFGDHGQQPQQHQQKSALESALERILGEDMEAYMAEQVEAYEKARKRWTGATFEEWLSGADELAESFRRMLDFAKDHVISKMKLHTTLKEKLHTHNLVLEEQEKILTQVKKDLIQNGGSLLGGA